MMYLLMTSPGFARLVRAPALRFMELCGRHSLEVFATGTMLSLLGRLLFRTFGTGWELQLLVNGVGFAALIGVARLLDRPRPDPRAIAAAQRVRELAITDPR
jgi:hypothetical protein